MSNEGSLDYIYLQPAELACPSEGRLWCEDDDPSGLDGPWVQYIRYDIHQRKLEEAKADQCAELKRIREALQEIATATTGEGYCFDSLKEIAQEAMPKVRSSGNE